MRVDFLKQRKGRRTRLSSHGQVFKAGVRSPHFGQDICAGSVEGVGFIIKGGDVGASQYGAETWTVPLSAVPLPVGAGAVKAVRSLHWDKYLKRAITSPSEDVPALTRPCV